MLLAPAHWSGEDRDLPIEPVPAPSALDGGLPAQTADQRTSVRADQSVISVFEVLFNHFPSYAARDQLSIDKFQGRRLHLVPINGGPIQQILCRGFVDIAADTV